MTIANNNIDSIAPFGVQTPSGIELESSQRMVVVQRVIVVSRCRLEGATSLGRFGNTVLRVFIYFFVLLTTPLDLPGDQELFVCTYILGSL